MLPIVSMCESYVLIVLWSELLMWVLWSLSLMIWITHCVVIHHTPEGPRFLELRFLELIELEEPHEWKWVRWHKGTLVEPRLLHVREMQGYYFVVAAPLPSTGSLCYSCDSYDLWVLWSELFMRVLWSLRLMIWIACSVPALSEICMKDGNKPFDDWKMPLMRSPFKRRR